MTDKLLERLALLEREARPPPDWHDALASPGSIDEVAQTRRALGDHADEVAALATACSPLNPDERRAWATRLRAALSESTNAAEPLGGHPMTASTPPIELRAHRTTTRPWLAATAVLLAAAAALLLVWLGPGRSAAPPATGSALPGFRLVVRNDAAHSMRSVSTPREPGSTPYTPDSAIHWMLQPQRPLEQPAELGAVLERSDGFMCLARPPVSRASPDGVFELRGRLDHVLGLRTGRWRIRFLVAPLGTLPPPTSSTCPPGVGLPCLCPPTVAIDRSTTESTTWAPPSAIESLEQSGPWTGLNPYEITIEPADTPSSAL